jgi:hypothetical protein
VEQHDLLEAFDQLTKATQSLVNTLASQQPSCWLPLTDLDKANALSPINKACDLFQDIWYTDGQDGRETRSCHGIIAANNDIVDEAKNINQLKDALRTHIKALQTSNTKAWKTIQPQLLKRHPGTQERLHWAGLDRLHLKQLYRHIPIIESPVEKIGFSWYTSGRSIKKITVNDAHKMFEKFNYQDKHINAQLSALSQLPSSTPLAQVQQLAPIMRANIVFEADQKVLRKAMNVSLPIIVASKNNKLPIFNPQSLTPPEQRIRLERSDQQLESDVFLPSLRIYRYQH